MEKLHLLYRDECLVAVAKPSGLLTHRGRARDRDTALARVRDMVGARVYLPHRLDRGTSGVLVAALDRETHRSLAALFAEQRVHKRYLALVRGHAPPGGTIDHAYRVEGRSAPVSAITDYRLVARAPAERASLVLAMPRSGRLHQVRRHLKHIHHPVVGDTAHGDGRINRHHRERYGLHRLALHALSIAFTHPATGASVGVAAPIPRDLAEPLAAMGLSIGEEALDQVGDAVGGLGLQEMTDAVEGHALEGAADGR